LRRDGQRGAGDAELMHIKLSAAGVEPANAGSPDFQPL